MWLRLTETAVKIDSLTSIRPVAAVVLLWVKKNQTCDLMPIAILLLFCSVTVAALKEHNECFPLG